MKLDEPIRTLHPIAYRVPWRDRIDIAKRILAEPREHPFEDGLFPTDVRIAAWGHLPSLDSIPEYAVIAITYGRKAELPASRPAGTSPS